MKCIKCNLDKEVEEFHKSDLKNCSYTCKVCKRELAKEYRKNMSEEQKRKNKDKKNARKRGISLEEYYKEVDIVNNAEKNGKKYCYTCCEVKELSNFGKHKATKDGLNTRCNECKSLRYKKYYEENLDYQREKGKKKYERNKKNIIKKQNEWLKNKIEEDPLEGTKIKYRALIYQAIHRYLKKGHKMTSKNPLYEVLGCDIKFFIKHIENQFHDGMTWQNKGINGWHIDHIIELKTANTIEEVKKLNHYTNLQPLWAKDNLAKNRKYV